MCTHKQKIHVVTELTTWTIFKRPDSVLAYDGSNRILGWVVVVVVVTVVVVVCCEGKPWSIVFGYSETQRKNATVTFANVCVLTYVLSSFGDNNDNSSQGRVDDTVERTSTVVWRWENELNLKNLLSYNGNKRFPENFVWNSKIKSNAVMNRIFTTRATLINKHI